MTLPPHQNARAASTKSSTGAVDSLIWPQIETGGASVIMAMQVQFEISQWWEPEQILSYQLAQLSAVIKHASSTVPFYQQRLQPILKKIAASGLDMETFRSIPILTRSEFQDAGTRIMSKAIPRSHGRTCTIRTSGSTGEPLELKGTEVTALLVAARSLRYHLWHRRDFTQKSMSFRTMKGDQTVNEIPAWGPSPNPGKAYKVSMVLPAKDLLGYIQKEEPGYIEIHPSVLKELLNQADEQKYIPTNLKEVRTMGEILYPELRYRCQEQWNVKVSDLYSCEEFGILAMQCPEQPEHYHVQSESQLIEVLHPDNTACGPGEIGKTVISSLNNFATPMLRYENGDMAEVGTPCSCGRGLPVLSKIVGRVRNTAILPNGDRIMPNLSTGSLLNELPIKHFQLIQKTTTLIEARLVVKRPIERAEEMALAAYFNKGWRHEFNFSFVYVDKIIRGANGKYEVFRCEVK